MSQRGGADCFPTLSTRILPAVTRGVGASAGLQVLPGSGEPLCAASVSPPSAAPREEQKKKRLQRFPEGLFGLEKPSG